ncbi:hypothetical protein PCANC_25597, partial [Puccinia coronata f. sp. avenae]
MDIKQTPNQINQIRYHGLQLWCCIINSTDSDGRLRSVAFMDLPSALNYPDYYQYIKHPISLNLIKSKLDSPRNPYLSLDKLLSALKLVFKNAKKYNLEYSVIYKDAQALLKIVRKDPFSNPRGDDQQDQSEATKLKQKELELKLCPSQAAAYQISPSTTHQNGIDHPPSTLIVPPTPIDTVSLQSPSQVKLNQVTQTQNDVQPPRRLIQLTKAYTKKYLNPPPNTLKTPICKSCPGEAHDPLEIGQSPLINNPPTTCAPCPQPAPQNLSNKQLRHQAFKSAQQLQHRKDANLKFAGQEQIMAHVCRKNHDINIRMFHKSFMAYADSCRKHIVAIVKFYLFANMDSSLMARFQNLSHHLIAQLKFQNPNYSN